MRSIWTARAPAMFLAKFWRRAVRARPPVIHRDLKHYNIRVTRKGRPTVDFVAGDAVGTGGSAGRHRSHRVRTRTHAVTPDPNSYAAIGGRKSDIDSGRVLLRIVTGARPYRLNAGLGAVLEHAIAARSTKASRSVKRSGARAPPPTSN